MSCLLYDQLTSSLSLTGFLLFPAFCFTPKLLLQTSQFSHMGQQNLMYCSVMKLTLMYLVAEGLARQAKLSSAHFN